LGHSLARKPVTGRVAQTVRFPGPRKMNFQQRLLRKLFALAMCGLLVPIVSFSGCRKRGAAQKESPHYRRAVEAYRKREYEAAVSLFQKALLYEPSNADIYLDIAAIYDDFLGDASRALSFYEKYLENPTSQEKARWVKSWAEGARKRSAAKEKEEGPAQAEPESVTDREKLVETLQEELGAAKQSLAEEKEKTRNLSDQVTVLTARLSAAEAERQQLRDQIASYSRAGLDSAEQGKTGGEEVAGQAPPPWHRHWVTVGWLLSGCLAFLVVALLIKQRYARVAEEALLASIQASASGDTEKITKEDILGKYYWVENDHSAGVLSFTEKDNQIHVCAIEGTTRLRSRGKGQLVGNVLTAELTSPGEKGVVTKFIFANKGRTLTAVWQGDEGTAVAAGTKEV
jgi:hypothetical protein